MEQIKNGVKLRRFWVYQARSHGKDFLGDSDTLDGAIGIGVKRGCQLPNCRCDKYLIFDSKLETTDLKKMFADCSKKIPLRIRRYRP